MEELTGRQIVQRGTIFGLSVCGLYFGSPSWDVFHHILLCTAMYVCLSMAISTHLGDKMYYYSGTGYPAWSWYISFIHNFVINMTLLVQMVRLHPPLTGAWNAWLMSSWVDLKEWEALEFTDKVDALSLCLGIAAELKDVLLLDVKMTSFSLGLLAHHTVTVCGCLGCFYVPVGKGIVVINGVNAYLGSAFFNIATTLPILWPAQTALHSAGRYLYYGMNTASNVTGLYLAYMFGSRIGLEASVNPWYARAYWIAVWALVTLRQGAVFQMIFADGTVQELSGSGKERKKD